jgi:hypothetical protein
MAIRLSGYFFIFFIAFCLIADKIPKIGVQSGYLLLVAVSIGILGFYLAALLAARKVAINELDQSVGLEANLLRKVLIEVEDLPGSLKEGLNQKVKSYIMRKAGDYRSNAADSEYQELLIFCRQHTKTSGVKVILDKLLDNEQYRMRFSLCERDRVYLHEWLVLVALYIPSVYLVLAFNYGAGLPIRVVAALVATGLVLPFLSLIKYANRTHKDAKNTWQPLITVIETDFRDFGQDKATTG